MLLQAFSNPFQLKWYLKIYLTHYNYLNSQIYLQIKVIRSVFWHTIWGLWYSAGIYTTWHNIVNRDILCPVYIGPWMATDCNIQMNHTCRKKLNLVLYWKKHILTLFIFVLLIMHGVALKIVLKENGVHVFSVLSFIFKHIIILNVFHSHARLVIPYWPEYSAHIYTRLWKWH